MIVKSHLTGREYLFDLNTVFRIPLQDDYIVYVERDGKKQVIGSVMVPSGGLSDISNDIEEVYARHFDTIFEEKFGLDAHMLPTPSAIVCRSEHIDGLFT